jgi:mono/diheme cytochrome c family protein
MRAWRTGGQVTGRGTLAAAAALFLATAVWSVQDGAIVRAEGAPAAQAAKAASASSDTYKDVYNGWKWWHVYCYRCHGTNAIGATTAPNLIDPNEKFTRADFMYIVKNGSPDLTMQAWDKLLDDKQIAQLYVYVKARADNVLRPGRPDEVGPNGGPWAPPAGWSPR